MEVKEIMRTAKSVWEIETQQIDRLIGAMDEKAFCALAEAIAACQGKILVSGCGTSGAAAKKIAHSLCCVEQPACFLTPSDAVHGALGMLAAKDILILISKGGNTAELLNLAQACHIKGAKLVAVTENKDSVLAAMADIALIVGAEKEPCPFNMLATASTITVIAVFDAMCIVLMHMTGYTREQFLVIHPGGAVGDKLKQSLK